MENIARLQQIIAHYWQLPSEKLDWETPLTSQHLRNFSSLRLMRFLASVEECFKISIEQPDAIQRFGDLLNLIERTDIP